MKLGSYLILFFLSFLASRSYSQSHVYKHYGVENGLPTSEVYSAFQDSKGYMWFGTNAGVSRFNGYEFENFDVSDGLTDNTVFLITEDYKGRIWFGTFNNQLSYYLNDSIYEYKHNDKLEPLRDNGAIQSFYVDSADNIWMGFYTRGIFKSNKNGTAQQLKNLEVGSQFKFFEIENRLIWGKKANLLHIDKANKLKQKHKVLGEFNLNDSAHFLTFHNVNNTNNHFSYYGSNTLGLIAGNLFLIKENGVSEEIKTNGLFSDKNNLFSLVNYDNYLFVCISNQGVYKCTIKNNELVVIDRFLSNESVSRVFKDNNNGLWFQTLKKGVYYLSSQNMKHYSFKNAITSLEIDSLNNSVYLGFNNGEVKLFEQEEKIFKNIADMKYPIFSLKTNYNNSSLLIGSAKAHFSYKNKKTINYNNPHKMGVKSFLVGNDSAIYKADGFGLSIIKNNKESYYSNKNGNQKIWCTSLIEYNNKVWIGTKSGIRIYDDFKISNPFSNDPYLSSVITSLERLNKNTLLLGTKSKGLVVLKNDRVVGVINEEDGLSKNAIKSIHVDNQKTIWVGTSNGLSRINYKAIDDFQIYNLNKKHGLISNEIIEINSFNNTIYVASSSGLVQFDRSSISIDSLNNPIYVAVFSVNSTKESLKELSVLSYKENFIKVHYEEINYRSQGNIEYKYRLLGADTNWIITTNRAVEYPALQANDYTFEVKAKNEFGIWGNSTHFSFTINPPFWETWWFNLLLMLFLISLVYLGFKVNLLAYNQHIQQAIFNRLLKKLGKQNYIFIEIDKKQIRINENSILFIEAFKNYVEINTLDKKFLYRSTMLDIEKKLSDTSFIRTHRSFIVQKDMIDSISQEQLKIQNHEIPIGKTYRPKLKELKNQFIRING